MMELALGLLLASVGFVGIMALVIAIGRTVGRFFGPKEDR